MRIAIDCADLENQRIDGTRVYIKNLLNLFGHFDKASEFLLYHREAFSPMLAPIQFKNYTDRKIPYRFWWTQTRLAFELKKDRPDVLWMPIQQLPYLSDKDGFKKVVTIHDLAFKMFPGYFKAGDRFKLNLFTDYAVKKANKIIAISENTKKDILKFYPEVSEDKIKVVYHGIDAHQKCKSKLQITNYKLQTDSKFQIPNSRFLLYVGAIQPRKNLKVLVEAFEGIKKDSNYNDLKLVLAGSPAWMAEGTLSRIAVSPEKRDIILTGRLAFEEINQLYQKAGVFVYPSLYEGFGIPILEAWAGEAPVIIADNSSLSEVGGDAVEKFNTHSSSDLAEKIKLILNDKNRRMELVGKGTERLKNFSWEKCARETLEVLKSS